MLHGCSGVGGRCGWRAGASAWSTEVGLEPLDGWREGGLGQQRVDGGGCATMHEG